MLTIRFQRVGKRGQPSYRLVVAERRSKVGAPPTEDLGAYNPFTKEASLKAERVNYWIGVGAQPTVTVHNLLVKSGVVTAPKRRVYMKQVVAKPVEAEASAAEVSTAEAPVVKSEEVSAPASAESSSEPIAEAPAEKPVEEVPPESAK